MTPAEQIADLQRQLTEAIAIAKLAFETGQAYATATHQTQETTRAALHVLSETDTMLLNATAHAEARCAVMEAFVLGRDVVQAFEAERERFKRNNPNSYRPEAWGQQPEWLERMMKGPKA